MIRNKKKQLSSKSIFWKIDLAAPLGRTFSRAGTAGFWPVELAVALRGEHAEPSEQRGVFGREARPASACFSLQCILVVHEGAQMNNTAFKKFT